MKTIQIMKTKGIHTLLVSFMILIGFCSCSLEENPEMFVNKDGFYKNREQCVSAVNSCYSSLSRIYSYKMMTLTDAHSDLFYSDAPSVTEARMEISPAQPGDGEWIWEHCYKMIMYANAAIAGTENSPILDEDKAQLLAEAKIMRAFYYNLLTSLFNDVPFYTEDVNTVEIQDKVAKLPRMSAVETRRYLIEELNTCIPSLPMIRTSEVEGNRAGAAVGLMLIGKMAMWNAVQDKEAESDSYWYDIALEALLQLEGIYGELAQYPLDDIMFRNKNTPESIFEIQHSYTPGGIISVSNLACPCMPYQTGSERGTNVYDGVVMEVLGNDANVWTPYKPNLYFCSGLQPRGNGDLRAELNMAWSYNGQEFNRVKNGGTPWMGPKFWCPGMRDTNDSNNYKVFRYADALLMMAECYCAKQDSENSLKYLNMVKSRAGLGNYSFRSWDRLLGEIQDERARELFGEYQRKFDLVRWGIWYARVSEINDYYKLRENIRPCHEYLPIPDKQVVYSGGALDNEEYNKYGM